MSLVETSWIISADDHVVEPPHVWSDRLSAADREVGPRVVRDTCETSYDPRTRMVDYRKGGDGPVVDWWLYEDVAKPIPTVVACAGLPFEAHTLDAISYADMRPGCFDPAARLVDMDTVRVERSLCFPYVTRFAGQMFLEAKDKDLALRCVRAYNDWMIDEWCGDSGGRLVPVTLVPLWDADLAAAEVRRCAARAVASSRSPRCRATSASRRSTTPPGTGTRCSRPATRRASCWGCTSGRGRRWPTSARTPPGRRPPR